MICKDSRAAALDLSCGWNSRDLIEREESLRARGVYVQRKTRQRRRSFGRERHTEKEREEILLTRVKLSREASFFFDRSPFSEKRMKTAGVAERTAKGHTPLAHSIGARRGEIYSNKSISTHEIQGDRRQWRNTQQMDRRATIEGRSVKKKIHWKGKEGKLPELEREEIEENLPSSFIHSSPQHLMVFTSTACTRNIFSSRKKARKSKRVRSSWRRDSRRPEKSMKAFHLSPYLWEFQSVESIVLLFIVTGIIDRKRKEESIDERQPCSFFHRGSKEAGAPCMQSTEKQKEEEAAGRRRKEGREVARQPVLLKKCKSFEDTRETSLPRKGRLLFIHLSASTFSTSRARCIERST